MKRTLLTLLSVLCTLFSVNSQTTFLPKVTIDSNTGNNPYTINSGLIDGDTNIDIVVGNDVDNILVWYKGNGDGTFVKQTAIANTLINIVGLRLVDLNNDTFNDLVVIGFGDYDFGNYGVGSSIVWFANDGNGNFGSEQLIYDGNNGLSGLFVGNIDSGSTPDIAFTSYADGFVYWMTNDGSGNFSGPNTLDNTLSFPGSIFMQDIDNDGDTDALVATGAANGNDVVEIFRNDLVPGGSVAFAKDATSVTSGKNFLFNATFNDLDGDSNLDILVTELETTPGAGGFYWIEENGIGGYTETQFTTSIGNPSVAQHQDLDGDGDKDIVLSSGAVADVTDIAWFLNDGSGNYGSEVVIENTQSQTYVYTISDFDNDTDLDIISCAFNEDKLYYLENELITLNTNDFALDAVTLYPNPTKNKLYIKGFKENDINIYISDILGKHVLKTSQNLDDSIDVSELAQGIYAVYTDGQFISKFIKE